MAQRVRSVRPGFNAAPFSGNGVSVYATVGAAVKYRALRTYNGKRCGRRRRIGIKGTGGQPFIRKTMRVTSASSPTATAPYVLPAAMLNATVTFDVRRFKDNVENESDNFRTQTVVTTALGADNTGILGTATLLDLQPRAGGIVRIRLVYHEARDGVQPTVFRAMRTAGPSSPANVTTTYAPGQRLVEIDTPALSDASAYTYKVRAENAAGSVTLDVLSGISVTADATGPSAPTYATAEAV